MKKIIIVLSFLLISFSNCYGQWYVKKYQVSDLNQLTREQLLESLESSKKSILYSGISAGVGALLYVLGKNTMIKMHEDPTFIEVVLGKKVINNLYSWLGASIFVGSTISAISYGSRVGKINRAIARQDHSFGRLNISPKLFSNDQLKSYGLGVSLAYNF